MALWLAVSGVFLVLLLWGVLVPVTAVVNLGLHHEATCTVTGAEYFESHVPKGGRHTGVRVETSDCGRLTFWRTNTAGQTLAELAAVLQVGSGRAGRFEVGDLQMSRHTKGAVRFDGWIA